MNRKLFSILVALLGFGLAGLSGCDMAQFKAERAVELSAGLEGLDFFEATTHNGAIKIAGIETDHCQLLARIEARGKTQERAQELVDNTKVTLEPSGNRLVVAIEKPRTESNESVSVSLEGTLKPTMQLKLETHNGAVTVLDIERAVEAETHNGAVEVSNVQGDIDASTHNGRVRVANAKGQLKLETHNGEIVCDAISGDADVVTYNGQVRIAYAKDAPAPGRIKAVTHNGSIDMTVPEDLSAEAMLVTRNGSIKTNRPIMISGEITKKRIAGKIGNGDGSLHVETYNGSITLR